jgi:predicted DNA-binding ribbon-helix-helix protein
MQSPVAKRSIVIAGHKTSVSLEEAFWKGLKEIASRRSLTLSELVATIDAERAHGNLSSAIRLFVLAHYRGAFGNGAESGRASEAAANEESSGGGLALGRRASDAA